MSTKPLTIERLEVTNFKRLRHVTIDAGGKDVTLRGRNAQGKSSVLDAIDAALFGRDAIPVAPVHDGFAPRAEVKIDLGEVIVEREFGKDGRNTLKITSKDPRQVSTQKWLDERLGARSFDPSSFLRLKAKEQAAVLRAAIGIDTSALDAQRAQVFEDRTVVNREVARLEGALVESPAPETNEDPVDVAALAGELSAITAQRAANERLRDAEVAAARRVSDVREMLAQAEAAHAVAVAEMPATLSDPDPAPIEAKLRAAESINESARRREARRKLADELAAKSGESAGLTAKIAEIDEAKQQLLETAQFPIPGISLVDDSVFLNGNPVEQASQAERLKLQVALWLAQNPSIRVLTLRDASLLDDDSRQAIASMVAAVGGQVWEEVVGTEGDGIVIEDGAVAQQVGA